MPTAGARIRIEIDVRCHIFWGGLRRVSNVVGLWTATGERVEDVEVVT